jgi:hypothetical protein
MLRFKKDALFVFILLAITYAYFYQDPGWNGNSRLDLTAAIVREGRLTIDSFYANEGEGIKTGDLSFYNNHYYTDKAIGSSVIAAVFYLPMYWGARLLGQNLSVWLMKYLLTLLVLGLPSALAGSLIYVMCEYISKSKFRAFIGTLSITLGTMSFPFSITFFGHQLAASLLFISFFLIFQLNANPAPVGNGRPFLIGLLLGLALITDYTTTVIALPLVLYYFYVLWKKQALRRVLAVVIPALAGLIPVALVLGYNILCYGQPFVNGYQYLVNPYFKEAMSHGIMGIGRPHPKVVFYQTFHPAQGLFWQSPVLLMVLVGWFFVFRAKQYRIEGLIAGVAFCGYLLLNSGYFMWWGGFSFGPRQIVPMLPFLCLPLIFVPRRLFPLVVILAVVSIIQMGIVAASNIMVPEEYFVKIARIGFFEYSAIYSYCLKQLIAGNYAWNLGQAIFGLKNWVSLLPIALAISGATLFMAFFPTRLDRNPQNQLGRFAS